MDDKGQVSFEYLMLILVAILILGTVTIPLVGRAIDASNDVSRASDAKVAVESIANAADIVYANGPGAKRTITFYIPQDGIIGFNNGVIYFDVTLSNGTTRRINAPTEYGNITMTPTSLTRGWHKAVISWPNKSNNILITVS
ncbi:MAG TPA: class III signal peptide-containing protein [Methanothermobacter sp.]|uniref:Class III signal peptide-containing protein n=1 Tax=Methanothermobacter tenebrarum TaxID=680118 RepID=A0ABM7YB78_9EURY|nr:class III signal peptide-containing protein [Methanothermobacter tenebrarum]MDI6881657.1 class III signal peptide-containing protein [Methanothermobacter sp.]BDH79371.1 hypothetical protein MTTB_07500 [Methanothermobacter tenebrarum]HHW16107.1 class III signal peptide-containing protein [Methanothermobacter sp.]